MGEELYKECDSLSVGVRLSISDVDVLYWVAAARIFFRMSLRVEGIVVEGRPCSSKLSHPGCSDATSFTVNGYKTKKTGPGSAG